jgi:MFS family permease
MHPDGRLRRARLAVALLFFTNGAVFANLLPRYPQIKDALDLSNAQFGVAVAAFPLGALVAGLAAAGLIRRLRSSRVAVIGMVLLSGGVLLAGLAPSWILLIVVMFGSGAMDAVTDVAQNSHGLRVQRAYGRSILNSFHAVWSMGAVAGGLMGGAAAGLGVAPGLHLAVSGLLFSVVVVASYRWLLAGPEPVEIEQPVVATTRTVAGARFVRIAVLVALVAIAAGGAVVEDSGSSWAALYLSGPLGAGVTVASLGFVALVGAQFVGRLVGDRLVDRFGERAVARTGGVLVAVGMGAALVFPSVPGTIAGFAAAGLGVATLVPAALHAADQLPGLRPGTGLAVVSWLMRIGFLLAPPLVGVVADAAGLRYGLLVVPLAGVVVILASGVLGKRRLPA